MKLCGSLTFDFLVIISMSCASLIIVEKPVIVFENEYVQLLKRPNDTSAKPSSLTASHKIAIYRAIELWQGLQCYSSSSIIINIIIAINKRLFQIFHCPKEPED